VLSNVKATLIEIAQVLLSPIHLLLVFPPHPSNQSTWDVATHQFCEFLTFCQQQGAFCPPTIKEFLMTILTANASLLTVRKLDKRVFVTFLLKCHVPTTAGKTFCTKHPTILISLHHGSCSMHRMMEYAVPAE
jgi:hypothetical protein